VVFNDRVTPYAHFARKRILAEIGLKNPTAALEPGISINSFEKYILFIYKIEQYKLSNIRIYEPQGEDKPARMIVAKRGEFIADPDQQIVKLKLIDGSSDEPDPDRPGSFYKLNFRTYFMTLNMAQKYNKDNIEKKPKDMTIQELQKEITKLKKERLDPAPIRNLITHINERLSLAFACLVFMLIGVPLAIITRRREKSINFGIAFLTVGVYYLMFMAAEALSLQGYVDPQIAMWVPNVVFAAIGTLLTYRLCVS